MFGALKRGRFRSLASLILVVNVVGEHQWKRTVAVSRDFLAAARLSCFHFISAHIFYRAVVGTHHMEKSSLLVIWLSTFRFQAALYWTDILN